VPHVPAGAARPGNSIRTGRCDPNRPSVNLFHRLSACAGPRRPPNPSMGPVRSSRKTTRGLPAGAGGERPEPLRSERPERVGNDHASNESCTGRDRSPRSRSYWSISEPSGTNSRVRPVKSTISGVCARSLAAIPPDRSSMMTPSCVG